MTTSPKELIILSDYGGVICLDQPAEDVEHMAKTAGMNLAQFHDAYWRKRNDYDKGSLSSEDYWADAIGHPPSDSQLSQLRILDVESWLHPNFDTIQLYRDLAQNHKIALLSNAPHDLEVALEKADWLPPMEARYFSCALRMVKPDSRIYSAVIEALDVAARSIVFIDDRLDNIEAAKEAGMNAIHFANAAELQSALDHFP